MSRETIILHVTDDNKNHVTSGENWSVIQTNAPIDDGRLSGLRAYLAVHVKTPVTIKYTCDNNNRGKIIVQAKTQIAIEVARAFIGGYRSAVTDVELRELA